MQTLAFFFATLAVYMAPSHPLQFLVDRHDALVELGVGTFAVVFLATLDPGRQHVAVKARRRRSLVQCGRQSLHGAGQPAAWGGTVLVAGMGCDGGHAEQDTLFLHAAACAYVCVATRLHTAPCHCLQVFELEPGIGAEMVWQVGLCGMSDCASPPLVACPCPNSTTPVIAPRMRLTHFVCVITWCEQEVAIHRPCQHPRIVPLLGVTIEVRRAGQAVAVLHQEREGHC